LNIESIILFLHLLGINTKGLIDMLKWALIFFIVAIVAAAFGFGGIAAVAVDLARILFVVFLVLFCAAIIMHLIRGRGL